MSIYSDHDQRLLDQQTGEEMDRQAQRRERREARDTIATAPVGPAHVFADADNNGLNARVLPEAHVANLRAEVERVTADFQQVHHNCIHARDIADRALMLLRAVRVEQMLTFIERAAQQIREAVDKESAAQQECRHGIPGDQSCGGREPTPPDEHLHKGLEWTEKFRQEPPLRLMPYQQWMIAMADEIARLEALKSAFAHDAAMRVSVSDRDTSNLVTLADCPPGLFRFNGELCFKSEYRTSRENGTSVCDAYVVASGEYFWGGTSVDSQREALKVQPVAGPAVETTREPRSSHERLVPPAGVDVFGEREWWMATAQRLQRQLALSEELEQAMADCIGVEDGQTFEQRAEELVVTEVAYQNKHGATAILSERPSYGPGMTEHSSDCRCYACTAKQFCPHCGKSEPHTHRVPGSAEPVIFPHGSPVKTGAGPHGS